MGEVNLVTKKYSDLLKIFPHFKGNCVILAAKLKPIIAKGWVEKAGLNWGIIFKKLKSNNWVANEIKTGVLLKDNLNVDEDTVKRQFGADSLKLLPLLQQAIKNSSEFDPEDGSAAEAIRDCILANGGSAVIEDGSSSDKEIGNTRHIIAIGGCTELNKKFLYKMSPLHFYYNNSMQTLVVKRRFKLEPNGVKEMEMRAIKNEKTDKIFYAETYDDGFLKKDYLLITTTPLSQVMKDKLFYTSIAGLYGAGTMAIKLFLKDFEIELKESIGRLKKYHYFQILCPVDEINNRGDYSYPKHIDFKSSKIYPIAESQDFMLKNHISRITQKEIIGKKLEYELLYSGKKRKLISSEEAEELRKRKGQKAKNEIFIDDESKEVFFNKVLIDKFQGQSYSILRHFLENGGKGGNKEYIYRCVWEDSTGAASEENISGAIDAAMKRFQDILRKHKIGNYEIKAEGVFHSKKVYLLKPRIAYCILKKI